MDLGIDADRDLNARLLQLRQQAAEQRSRSRELLAQSRRLCRSAPVAGAEGLEPPAYGFGDRRSTN